jgi:hypothetical protein
MMTLLGQDLPGEGEEGQHVVHLENTKDKEGPSLVVVLCRLLPILPCLLPLVSLSWLVLACALSAAKLTVVSP